MLKESLINIADNVKAEDKESRDRLKEGDKAGQEERVLQIFRAFVFKK